MTRMFTFDPAEHAAAFAAQEYVHIRQGLTEEFFAVVCRQVDEYQRASPLGQKFAIGDKQQALYHFPDEGDCLGQFLDAVAGVAGLDPTRLVVSERHIKAYGADADPEPLAHKDRFATELAVGFSVHVPAGSTLVLYPGADRAVNPFQSSTELRASLPPERLPELTLRGVRPVEIQDRPRDVVLFRGSTIWHLRRRPARTVMLYFKLNAFHCDPLGEDPRAAEFRARTLGLAAADDARLAEAVPILGRRVDYVHRRYNHHWQEVLGAALYGERPVTLDEHEFRALRAMDGRRTVAAVARAVGLSPADLFARVRRLAGRGLVDLLPAAARDAAAEPQGAGAAGNEPALRGR
jgi:hypothetical protein